MSPEGTSACASLAPQGVTASHTTRTSVSVRSAALYAALYAFDAPTGTYFIASLQGTVVIRLVTEDQYLLLRLWPSPHPPIPPTPPPHTREAEGPRVPCRHWQAGEVSDLGSVSYEKKPGELEDASWQWATGIVSRGMSSLASSRHPVPSAGVPAARPETEQMRLRITGPTAEVGVLSLAVQRPNRLPQGFLRAARCLVNRFSLCLTSQGQLLLLQLRTLMGKDLAFSWLKTGFIHAISPQILPLEGISSIQCPWPVATVDRTTSQWTHSENLPRP